MSGGDTNSPLLQLLLMGDGLHNSDWGDQTNTNLLKVENAIANTEAIAVTSTAMTLTGTQSNNGILNFTGSLTGNTVITVPELSKLWIVRNSTTMGSYTLTMETAASGGPTTAPIPAASIHLIYCDGTNVIDLTALNATTLSVNTILANLGTGTVNATYAQILEALNLNTDDTPSFAGLNISKAAATTRLVQFETANSLRWVFGAEATPESGSNAGSNLILNGYLDDGVTANNALTVYRATFAATWNGSWTANGYINAPNILQGGAQLIPAGAVMAFAMQTVPAGWLECNGAAYSRTSSPALFAAIGTTYGAGDGSTTFNVPNYSGYFLRAWDHGAGIDPGRAFGSSQQDQFQDHSHAPTNPYFIETAGAPGTGITGGTGVVVEYGVQTAGASSGNHGTESRPKNYAVLYCIKA